MEEVLGSRQWGGRGEGGQMESADAYMVHGQPSLAGNSADGARRSLVITQP